MTNLQICRALKCELLPNPSLGYFPSEFAAICVISGRPSEWIGRCLFAVALFVGVFAPALLASDVAPSQPWRSSALSLESGILWEVGSNTPFPYRMLQTQLSWRSSEVLGRELPNGTRLLVRHRFTFIGTSIQQAPESRYVAFSASPSVEWWNRAGSTALATSVGGGFGLIDSRGVKGGQGQNFTLNWFARTGVERVISRTFRLNASVMFQHLSNAGQTNPNPGIDVLGFMISGSWSR